MKTKTDAKSIRIKIKPSLKSSNQPNKLVRINKKDANTVSTKQFIKNAKTPKLTGYYEINQTNQLNQYKQQCSNLKLKAINLTA